MTKDKDIIATADPDAPELLEEIALDQLTGGAQYGSSNSCAPVSPAPTETITLNYEPIRWSEATLDTRNAKNLKSS